MTDAVATAADGDALSPAEEAYFASAGEKLDGIEIEEAPAEQEAAASEKTEGDKPEAKAEGEKEAETEKAKAKQTLVPHGAMEKERVRRKAAEAKLAETETARQKEREDRIRLETRQNLINEALARREQPVEKPVEPPDPKEDIFGYVEWQKNKIAELEGRFGQTERASQESVQAQQEAVFLQNAYRADAQQFVTATPDFGNAYQFLLGSRDKQLEVMGFAPHERAQMIANEEMNIVRSAMQRGTSPAKVVYELARATGYRLPEKVAETTKEAEPTPAPNDNGATGKAPDKVAEAEKLIDQIQRGQGATKTLSGGGTAGDGPLSAEALLAMSDDEFAAYEAKLSPAERRKVFGGA